MAAPGARRPSLSSSSAGLAHGASALFEVKNNGTTCIMASFSASFSTTYETANGSQIVNISSPASAEVSKNGSSCGKENVSDPSLTITFGRGYLSTLNFTKNTTRYSVQHMYFTYNLSDTEHFPNAISKEIYTMDSTTDIKADINKAYRCVSDIRVYMKNVTVVLRDATIQAYSSSGNFSKEETHCTQDGPSPTTGPPSPSPPLVPTNPTVSKYNVTGNNGTCSSASMASQSNITYSKKDNKTVTRAFNISPNDTSSGSCGINLVTSKVENKNRASELQFGMNASSSSFFSQGVRLNMTLPDALVPTFSISNHSSKALQATVGNSYKCNTEEHIFVSKMLSLNVFSVQVQAFKVDSDRFGSVEECVQDGNNMLIPIAVGGASAGSVLIVLIAYLIGRKRSHAGYQTI